MASTGTDKNGNPTYQGGNGGAGGGGNAVSITNTAAIGVSVTGGGGFWAILAESLGGAGGAGSVGGEERCATECAYLSQAHWISSAP